MDVVTFSINGDSTDVVMARFPGTILGVAGAAVVVVSPAVQALVRKLLTARRRTPASVISSETTATSATFEVITYG